MRRKGNITFLLENIMCSSNEDLPRFIKFYEEEIAAGNIEEHIQKFESTKKQVKLMRDEKDEAEKIKKERGMGDLVNAIMLRHQERQNGNLLDILADKYAPSKKKAKPNETAKVNKKVKGK